MTGVLVALLFWSNLIVVAFNLLPGLPLDGGRLLRSVVWATRKSRLTGTRAGAVTGRALGRARRADRAHRRPHHVRRRRRAAQHPARDVHVDRRRPGAARRPDHGPRPDRRPRAVAASRAARAVRHLGGRGAAPDLERARPRARARRRARPPGRDRRRGADRVRPDRTAGRGRNSPPSPGPWRTGSSCPVGLAGEDLLDAVRRTPANEYLVVNADGSPAGILSTIDLAHALQAST